MIGKHDVAVHALPPRAQIEERSELSGLVLSGFDESGRRLDQAFRLQDIYQLRLNADLVVLSACETAVGKQSKGEGLMRLNNAFLQSGARSVAGSLWKVKDGATLELMKHFYAAMKHERLAPARALRKAQLALYESERYRSPFYWAAFTVQGDYEARPQPAAVPRQFDREARLGPDRDGQREPEKNAVGQLPEPAGRRFPRRRAKCRASTERSKNPANRRVG